MADVFADLTLFERVKYALLAIIDPAKIWVGIPERVFVSCPNHPNWSTYVRNGSFARCEICHRQIKGEVVKPNVVVFDIEASFSLDQINSGFPPAEEQQFGVAVLHDLISDEIEFYGNNVKWFSRNRDALKARLMAADAVIGFNHVPYDYVVLFGAGNRPAKPKDIDLLDVLIKAKFGCDRAAALERFGMKVVFDGTLALERIVAKNLALQKVSSANAAVAVHEGNYALAFSACLNHTRVTQKLFSFLASTGAFRDGAGRLFEVDPQDLQLMRKVASAYV